MWVWSSRISFKFRKNILASVVCRAGLLVLAFTGVTPFKPQDDKCFYKSIFRFSGPQSLNSADKQKFSRVLRSLFASEIASSYVGKITGMPGYLNMDLPLVSLVQRSVSQLWDSQRSRTRLNIQNYMYRDVKDIFQDVFWASDAEPDACLSVVCWEPGSAEGWALGVWLGVLSER